MLNVVACIRSARGAPSGHGKKPAGTRTCTRGTTSGTQDACSKCWRNQLYRRCVMGLETSGGKRDEGGQQPSGGIFG